MQAPDTLPTVSAEVRAYLRAVARKGGLAKSARKSAAVRENGKLGGRPRKVSTPNTQHPTN